MRRDRVRARRDFVCGEGREDSATAKKKEEAESATNVTNGKAVRLPLREEKEKTQEKNLTKGRRQNCTRNKGAGGKGDQQMFLGKRGPSGGKKPGVKRKKIASGLVRRGGRIKASKKTTPRLHTEGSR